YVEAYLRVVRHQRPAPTSRPERAHGRQRQQRRVERQDRAMGGEVVGRGACGRGYHDAVADQFVETNAAVDGDAYLRRLSRLAEQRHLVDGDCRYLLAV